jgi:carboxymethylenebutenolidase
MEQIRTESTAIRVENGEMRVYAARPAGDRRSPAILVFQEAFGVNVHIREVAERLARAGYLALAPELFHRTGAGIDLSYDDLQAAMAQLRSLTNEGLENDIRATFELARRDPSCDGHIASIGFCMGGRVSFVANSIVPLRAAVSFYGGGIAPALLDRASQQHAPILFLWGGLDKHIGEEQRAAVRASLDAAAKPYVDVLFSFADHGFFCNHRASFDAAAARGAWALTTEFLASNLRQTN